MAHRIRRSGDGWLGCKAVQHSRTELGAGNAPMIKHFAQDLSGPAGCISFYACYDHILMISHGEHWCCGQWRSKPPKQQGSVPRRFDLAVVRCRTKSQRDKWLWRCEENNGSEWQMEKVFASFVPHSSHDVDYNFTYIYHSIPYTIYHIPYTIYHKPYIANLKLAVCKVKKTHPRRDPKNRLMNSVEFLEFFQLDQVLVLEPPSVLHQWWGKLSGGTYFFAKKIIKEGDILWKPEN